MSDQLVLKMIVLTVQTLLNIIFIILTIYNYYLSSLSKILNKKIASKQNLPNQSAIDAITKLNISFVHVYFKAIIRSGRIYSERQSSNTSDIWHNTYIRCSFKYYSFYYCRYNLAYGCCKYYKYHDCKLGRNEYHIIISWESVVHTDTPVVDSFPHENFYHDAELCNWYFYY